VLLTVESKGTRMQAYHRLTEGERNQVYALKKAGLTQCAIADQICVNKSTICRELKRNAGLRGYRPKQAHRLAFARQLQIRRIRICTLIRKIPPPTDVDQCALQNLVLRLVTII